MRSDSPFTRSSISSTSQSGVKTSPWSATRCRDLTMPMAPAYGRRRTRVRRTRRPTAIQPAQSVVV